MKTIATALTILSLLSGLSLGQTPQGVQGQPEPREKVAATDAKLLEAQRRSFAISVVISLANDAKSYGDLALRPLVLAQAADVLWDADNVTARGLFFRAWEAAEKGDAEEAGIKTKDNPPPMALALRRASGRDLRSEVVGLVARRDRALADDFLAKLKREDDHAAKDSKTPSSGNNWSGPEASAKRLLVATRLLREGQTEQALGIAAPALDQVNALSINFLSELRSQDSEAADRQFLSLLTRTEFDPLSDANTVSGLSSYALTPGFYITFKADGGATFNNPEQAQPPPNLRPALRDRFFQVAANILLRPEPPRDQDFSSSGLAGKMNVIRRLLPVFEQYNPEVAVALRARLSELTGGRVVRNENPLFTRGLREDDPGEVLARMQDRIDHSRTSGDRDEIYAAAAVTLATRGDLRARDIANKIDESNRQLQVRQFVDFQLVRLAVEKKAPQEAAYLAKTGQLSHTQRALAYTLAARLVVKSQRQLASELLGSAIEEALRIDGNARDRAVLLVGIAMQLTVVDPSRAWDVMDKVVRAANMSEDFTGENVVRFTIGTRGGINALSFGGHDFSLAQVFRVLAKDDFYRSLDLTHSFNNNTPRATSILAVAGAVLEKPRS